MSDKKYQPISVKLEKDKFYYWCACGHSQDQPWCDGSHKAYYCEPVMFTPETDGTKKLCVCKKTGTPPYCDGTHKTLNQKDE